MTFLRHTAVGAGLLVLLLAAAGVARGQADVPALTGRVVDAAGILSPETERLLDGLLAAHEDSTTNQVVVLTVSSLEGEDIEGYALRVARAWRLGQEGRDNGLLVLVAPNDRKTRIEVGYGLEGDVPDAVAARIIRNVMIPHFRDGDFEGGVTAGVAAVLDAVAGVDPPEDHGTGGPPPVWLRVAFVLAFLLVPTFLAGGALLSGGAERYVAFVLAAPFYGFGFFFLFLSVRAGVAAIVLYLAGIFILNRREGVKALRARVKAAIAKGDKVPIQVGGRTFHVGGAAFTGGSGGSGGGGFSGGGGSFGGGGASGSW